MSSPRWCSSGSSRGRSAPSSSTRQGTGCRATKSQPVRAQVGDRRDDEPPVRRVGGQRAVAARLREPAEPRAVERDLVDVVDEVAVRRLVAGGDEGERGAVGTPGDVGAVGVARRDLDRFRRRDGVVGDVDRQVEDEDLAAAVGQETDVVQAVLQGRDQPRRLGRRGDALDGPVPPLLRHPRRVGEPPGVRRPHRRAGPEVVVGQPARRPRRRWAGRATCGLPPGSALR